MLPFGNSLGPGAKDGAVASFTEALKNFYNLCETSRKNHFEISKLITKLGFKKRRFYDVINVFETLGICCKLSSNLIEWKGIDYAYQSIEQIALEHGVFNADSSLGDIVENDDSIAISTLTECLINCFLALQKQNLDIKEISNFIARNTGREKTVLCKLYQIVQILQVLGIITKTDIRSQFRMNDKYFSIIYKFPKHVIDAPHIVDTEHDDAKTRNDDLGPMELWRLLNRQPDFDKTPSKHLEDRYKEYREAQYVTY